MLYWLKICLMLMVLMKGGRIIGIRMSELRMFLLGKRKWLEMKVRGSVMSRVSVVVE